MAGNKRIEIYDTTLRDGTQGEGVSLSVQDKLLIAEALDKLAVDYIEGGYPGSNPKDAAFFAEAGGRSYSHARIVAFGMTRRKATATEADAGLRALLDAATEVVTIVGKSWDLHVREVLRADEDENLRMIAESVALLAGAGREVFFDAEHFFDGWAADGGYAVRTLRAARDAGAACLVLCDTNGGTAPERLTECIDAVRAEMGDVRLGVHTHNDNALAVANALSAVLHGVTQVQGTMNGMGERCGNADLTAVIPNLAVRYGYDCLAPGTLRELTETSRFVYEVANLNLRENQPFVGAAAFAHKGGMHVHAVSRNATTYEHIDPALVGNTRRILVSEVAGRSNIAATVPAKFALGDDRVAQQAVLDEVMRLEAAGYQFEAAEASFEILVRKTLGGKWYRKLWQLDHYRAVIFKQDDKPAPSCEAIVKLAVDGKVRHTVAEAMGPVDSLHASLCEALRESYPMVDDLHLVDYKVRVVNTQAETAATVRVVIDWHNATDGAYFGSVGVSENIIDASWLALVDAVEYKLLNEAPQD
jgi:2-isopropylmalate synthase